MEQTYNLALNNIKKLIKHITDIKVDTEDDISNKKNLLKLSGQILEDLENKLCYLNYRKTSKNFIELITSLYTRISEISTDKVFTHQRYTSEINDELNNILLEFKRMKKMNVISNVENTVVLIGANGSGKSSFIDYLKQSQLDNLFVIPAQKYLFFSEDTQYREKGTIETYRDNTLKTNYIDVARSEDSGYVLEKVFTHPFSLLITALVKDYTKVIVNQKREGTNPDKEPIWTKIEKIWSRIFPDISFKIESDDRKISAKKLGTKYPINGLSDGEKCVLFYIGNVLIAPKDSYIVVDEPETFLNPSIYNKLWDLLIQYRNDCQFIFASHNMDFVTSRTNSSYVWSKEFVYPDEFKLELVENTLDFPKKMLTELVGSKKPILFCEGTYDSLDYQIYSKLFIDDYLVKPVGGHTNVINYTKGFNSIKGFHGNKSLGIIDGDFWEEIKIQKLEKDSVFVLPFNEIEMFLLSEEIIDALIEPLEGELKASEIFDEFHKELKSTLDNKKDKMILSLTKEKVDMLIKRSLINNIQSKESIKEEVENISGNIDVEDIYQSNSKNVNQIIEKGTYKDLIKVCNLKGEILNDLGNKYLFPKYKEYAIKKISIDNELQKKLVKRYFSGFMKMS